MDVFGVVDFELLVPPTDPWFEWEGGHGVSPEDWQRHPELLEAGLLRFSFGGFVLRGGAMRDRTVLIDCGNGPHGDTYLPPGSLLQGLRAAGLEPDDITDVLLTHLHSDHTGWLAVDGASVFQRAAIHVHADDLRFFTDPATPGESAAVTPERMAVVDRQLTPFSGELSLLPGIRAVPAPGHTPGSTVFVAADGDQRVVFLGDVVHCPVQLVDEEWAVLGDVDPELAKRSREIVEREAQGASIAGAHFPGLRLGRVIRADARRSWAL